MSAQEALSARRQEGVQAATILAVALPLLEERERYILKRAILCFRGGTLDGTSAIANIAALAELYAFREDLEHRIRQGERAAAALVEGTQ